MRSNKVKENPEEFKEALARENQEVEKLIDTSVTVHPVQKSLEKGELTLLDDICDLNKQYTHAKVEPNPDAQVPSVLTGPSGRLLEMQVERSLAKWIETQRE